MPNQMPFTNKQCKQNFRILPRNSLPAQTVVDAIETAGYAPKDTKKENCNMAFKKHIHLPLPHYTQDEKNCGNDYDDGVNHTTDELHELCANNNINGHSKMNRSRMCRSLINAGVNVSGGRPGTKQPTADDAAQHERQMVVYKPHHEGRRKRKSRSPLTKSACKTRSMRWVKRHKSKSNGNKVMVRGSCRKKHNK